MAHANLGRRSRISTGGFAVTRKDKRQTQIKHAKRRSWERFGITMTPQLQAALVEQISSGKASVVERQSNRVTVHRVTLPDGQVARAVYDARTKVVVTLLPDGDFWPLDRAKA
jgi:hypothetical protein